MIETRTITWNCVLAVALAALFASAGAKAQTAKATGAAALGQTTPPRESWLEEAVRGAHGMVASDEELGSQAGVEILGRGGNAVDAAVAVAFALAVVEPAVGNIGGGGFMLVRLADGRTTFLDYRETAPAKATKEMYIGPDGQLDGEASVTGYKAVAVPGTVAGLELALKTYGTMKLRLVMAPAIRLARDGFKVSDKLDRQLQAERANLERFPMSRRVFLSDGRMLRAGDTLRQPELAATLERIAKKGAREFYGGKTARILAQEMQHEGGLIRLEDLAGYKPKVRDVLHAAYSSGGHTWELLTAPPPSSGGVAMIEALNILKDVPLKSWDDVDSVHMVVETMRRVFADRAAYLADPDFAQVPVAGLTDACYAKELAEEIDRRHAASSNSVRAGRPHTCGSTPTSEPGNKITGLGEGSNTTHFSIVDSAGNAVASTYTLNNSYGSHVTCAAGFLLNDEMDDFTTQPGVPNALFGLIQSEANVIAPGHRPLSSMTPTIVLRDGKLSFVTGSPGGPAIISATLLSVLNWMRLGMNAQAAVNAPRFHHQWLPDVIVLEERFPETVEQALEARGFTTKRRGHIGLVNAIGIDPQTRERLGAADPRDHGAAVGY